MTGEIHSLRPDARIDLETLRFIRERSIPDWVPNQRLTGLGRRSLAELDHTGWHLTAAGRQELARLAALEREDA